MAKIYKEELAQVQTEEGLQQAYHHRSVEDDCPIPQAEELQKFKEIDPRLVEFFMEQSRLEQIQRHKSEDIRLDVIKNVSKQEYRVNIVGLWIMLFVVLILASLSAFFVYLGNVVTGSILAIIDATALLGIFAGVIKDFKAS